MRSFLVGLLFIVFSTSIATAQIRGEVSKIGFENAYRPDCWTPMIVHIIPDATTVAGDYQIQVKQEDLDRDHPIFTKTISITGASADGHVHDQFFSVYFKPQPTGDGLPDANDSTRNSLRDLQDVLEVSLCSSTGKWIAPLPITNTIQSVDPKTGSTGRGQKLILAVTDGRTRMSVGEYDPSHTHGLMETPTVIHIRPHDLPESVLGYDAVDAVIWLSADPAELKGGSDERFRALESYVRRGGKLVICTPAEWQKLLSFGDLLPVTIEGTATRDNLEPLKSYVRAKIEAMKVDQFGTNDSWESIKGPFTFARASAKTGTVVDDWIDWKKEGGDRTPYLARQLVGVGSVSWVAQDLGDPYLARNASYGWPLIWDHIFDWKDDPQILSNATTDQERAAYSDASGVDLGTSLLNGMELPGKSVLLITLAVVFFIAYWLVAGPGAYAFLMMRKQTGASWFVFGLSALVATLLTVVIVKATLRGAPSMKHVSLVRQASGIPAHVLSRFGLYIPRDGLESIELTEMAPDTVASITAFAIHPLHLSAGSVPDDPGPDYTVSFRDAASADPATIRVPFRSTLKKFEADWTGDVQQRITGSGKLLRKDFIEGSITNATGGKLRNVYIGFRYNSESAFNGDWLLYLPSWDAGITLDLNREFNLDSDGSHMLPTIFNGTDRGPERGYKVRGLIKTDWQPFWFSRMSGQSLMDQAFSDYGRAIPMLSFFDRLEPAKNKPNQHPDRFELFRRSGRHYDISAALGAGGLVVVAEADGDTPLPIPLTVDGDKVTGDGSTVYQAVLPLDISLFNSPTTQPNE